MSEQRIRKAFVEKIKFEPNLERNVHFFVSKRESHINESYFAKLQGRFLGTWYSHVCMHRTH